VHRDCLHHRITLTGSQVASGTRWNISQTFWHRLPIFQVDLHCVLHRVAASSCCRHVDELATEPFLLLHRKHGAGYQRSWNCCDQRICFVVIWKHFCFILSTGTKTQIDSVMCPLSSSRECNTSPSVTVSYLTTVSVLMVWCFRDCKCKCWHEAFSAPVC